MQPVFAIPCVSHSVSVEFLYSFFASSNLLTAAGVTHNLININGDCYLASARNRLVHKFLSEFPEATDLFFLDDDVGWTDPEAPLRMLLDPEDVVAGAYPKKQETLEFPVVMDESQGHLIQTKSGLFKALRVPTGFLRIRRHVMEKMAAACPTYRQALPDGSFIRIAEIFRMGAYGTDYWWGEDFDWCNRWREMGGEIWVDPSIEFTHSGRKQWKGRLWDSAIPVQKAAAAPPEGKCRFYSKECRSTCWNTGECVRLTEQQAEAAE